MSTTKQRYAVYRDDTLIAADLTDLAAIKKFAREDARREYSQARPACYVITGSSGFKRVGSHSKGTIRWVDQSQVHSCFGTPSSNQPPAAPQAVPPLSRSSVASPSKAFRPSAPARKVREVPDAPGAPQPDPAQNTFGSAKITDEPKPPGN
jgi:hypothetical protein